MSKKWKYKEKSKQYGYVAARSKRIVCSVKKSGPVQSLQPDSKKQFKHTPDSTHVQYPGTVYSSGEGADDSMGHVADVGGI